jgi:hypothetical protein
MAHPVSIGRNNLALFVIPIAWKGILCAMPQASRAAFFRIRNHEWTRINTNFLEKQSGKDILLLKLML